RHCAAPAHLRDPRGRSAGHARPDPDRVGQGPGHCQLDPARHQQNVRRRKPRLGRALPRWRVTRATPPGTAPSGDAPRAPAPGSPRVFLVSSSPDTPVHPALETTIFVDAASRNRLAGSRTPEHTEVLHEPRVPVPSFTQPRWDRTPAALDPPGG